VYLHRESQLHLHGWVSVPFDGGLFEDIHGLHQDQGERLKIVQTRMQTDMGACTYTGLRPLSDQASQSKSRTSIQSNINCYDMKGRRTMCIDYGTEKREEDLSYIQRILGKLPLSQFTGGHNIQWFRWLFHKIHCTSIEPWSSDATLNRAHCFEYQGREPRIRYFLYKYRSDGQTMTLLKVSQLQSLLEKYR